ncbi:MAG: RNA polymerase sigma factor SigJ [Janthinobacterium lividum]
MSGDGALEEFDEHRPLLLGLAYRVLGSMWDAEDVVQDAYLRWVRDDRSQVREPRAYLMTVVSRLALDQLRSARAVRETYPGEWLPEPAASSELGPMDTAELRDTVAYATLHMMERLSPPERTVFVLREAFGLPYDEITGVVGASNAACRQLYHRAAVRLSGGKSRFRPSERDHDRLLHTFLGAAQSGDLDRLMSLMSEEVSAWNDGGGRVRAALHPVRGRAKVATFISGLVQRYGTGEVRYVQANGGAAAWTALDGRDQLVTIAVNEGVITDIYAVLNPHKLERLLAATTW